MSAPDSHILISVVVPCKNDSRFLDTNLESILGQDYPHIECIVVDGGSTDATLDLLQQYGDRIRWVSQPDRGAFDAINRGWQLATGNVLTWLNADDFWEPGAASAVVEFLKHHPDVDVVYGTAGVVDELGRECGSMVPRHWDLEHALLFCDHIIFQPASFMRRGVLARVNWLYPAWCHDHDLWLRIARAGGTFAVMPRRLAVDRLRFGNLGSVAELVIPHKIALTKRFFDEPTLPEHLRRLKRRSISNSYLRGVDYLQPGGRGHVLWGLALVSRALVADPTNTGAFVERAFRPVRGRLGHLASTSLRLCARTWAVMRGAVKQLLTPWRSGSVVQQRLAILERQVADAAMIHVRESQAAREALDRIEAGVIRPLEARLAQLTAAIEQSSASVLHVSASLKPLSARIDQMSTAVPILAERIERNTRVSDVLLSLSRNDRTAAVSDSSDGSLALASLPDVYGSPPSLRRIPGWHTYWGIDQGDRLMQQRMTRWSSLDRPVLMRWLTDLLVVIYPGNELSRVLFLTGIFEPNELLWVSQNLGDGMTMLDVGAHMGMYTLLASRLAGESGVVVSIEPSSREFQRLTAHVGLNGLGNVRCSQEAVSDTCGEAMLKIAWEWNSGHNTIGAFFDESVREDRQERVRTRTIDAIVAAEALSRVDVIKIDVEGHEVRVLSGAADTLQRFRPKIILEVFGEALLRQNASVDGVLAELDRYGYVVHEFSESTGEPVPLSRVVDNRSRNLVAIPK